MHERLRARAGSRRRGARSPRDRGASRAPSAIAQLVGSEHERLAAERGRVLRARAARLEVHAQLRDVAVGLRARGGGRDQHDAPRRHRDHARAQVRSSLPRRRRQDRVQGVGRISSEREPVGERNHLHHDQADLIGVERGLSGLPRVPSRAALYTDRAAVGKKTRSADARQAGIAGYRPEKRAGLRSRKDATPSRWSSDRKQAPSASRWAVMCSTTLRSEPA